MLLKDGSAVIAAAVSPNSGHGGAWLPRDIKTSDTFPD